MSDPSGRERPRYGNWMPVRQAVIGGLTLPGWAILLGGLLLMVLFIIRGLFFVGLGVMAVVLVFELVCVVRFGGDSGQTIATRLLSTISGARRIDRGEARFNSGLFSNLPADSLTSLPGLLGGMEEIDGTDGTGQPFTLLHHKGVKTLTAVFECNPDGIDLIDSERVDADVALYGGWVASHANDSAIAGSVVIVDSALRSSAPLIEKVEGMLDPDAPAIAREHTMEAAHRLPSRYTETATWASVTWSINSLASNIDDAVAEVAAKLPYHREALRAAGGGSVRTATSERLATAVQIAYNPDRSAEIASDMLRGHGGDLRVSEAGPEYFDDSLGRRCLHEGVASMSVLVIQPPRIRIRETSLQPLFAPSDRFLRKRVAVFYRPVEPGKAVGMVENLNNTVSTVSTSKARQTARDRMALKHAQKLEEEVTMGAGITRFGMAVTVTFEPDDRSYREATAKLKSLLDSGSLRYRFCEWDSSAVFHSTLPLGILPWLYESQVETVVGAVS